LLEIAERAYMAGLNGAELIADLKRLPTAGAERVADIIIASGNQRRGTSDHQLIRASPEEEANERANIIRMDQRRRLK
jgi:hypothetical protein